MPVDTDCFITTLNEMKPFSYGLKHLLPLLENLATISQRVFYPLSSSLSQRFLVADGFIRLINRNECCKPLCG